MLLAALSGWLEHEQSDVIAFRREENRALKAQLAGRRLQLNLVMQAVRSLANSIDGVLADGCVLICDRDRKWSRAVLDFLEHEGIRIIQTPFRAPNCNAYAERFVRSIKEECLERVIPLGERHLRRTIAEFVAHYHGERNHQGIGNELIQPLGRTDGQRSVRRVNGSVAC
jgi:putative transposase